MELGRHNLKDRYGVVAVRRAGLVSGLDLHGRWGIRCRDRYGNIKWEDFIENLVVDAGVNYALDAALSGGTPITSWFVGITGTTPSPNAADTMASHGGWTEVTAYDEATRVAWTDGGVSGKSVDNVGNEATFTISANGTVVGGAFLVSNSTKGGSTGTLYAVGAFSAGDKSLDDNDTLDVTATFTG